MADFTVRRHGAGKGIHSARSSQLLPAFFFCGIYECLAGKAVSDSGTFAEFGAGSTAARLFSI